MLNKSVRINKNYAIDFSALHLIRSFLDGISFLESKINLDLYKGDHNPKLEISLIVLNFKIFEIIIYNVNHVEK